MKKAVKDAIKRLENELSFQDEQSTSTGYAIFLEDLATLIAYAKTKGAKK